MLFLIWADEKYTQKNPCVVFTTQKNAGVFHRPKKIPFGQNVRPKKILQTPPSLKYVSGAPGFVTHTAYKSWHQENQVANVPIKKISTRPLFWLFCSHFGKYQEMLYTFLYTFQQQKCFMENAEAIWTCIFKIRSRVKMEMCFCDYLLCIISSICRFTYLKFFIISSSFFFPGILNSWLIRLHGSEGGTPHFKWQGWSQDSGFEIFDFGISFW